MKVTLDIFLFIILFAPIIWEYGDDKEGDHNKKRDVWIRSAIGLGASFINYIFGHNIFAAAFMCFALFFLIFDYWIGMRFAPKGVSAFEYLGNGTVDNIGWWRNMNPWYRFGIRVAVFILATVIYF